MEPRFLKELPLAVMHEYLIKSEAELNTCLFIKSRQLNYNICDRAFENSSYYAIDFLFRTFFSFPWRRSDISLDCLTSYYRLNCSTHVFNSFCVDLFHFDYFIPLWCKRFVNDFSFTARNFYGGGLGFLEWFTFDDIFKLNIRIISADWLTPITWGMQFFIYNFYGFAFDFNLTW